MLGLLILIVVATGILYFIFRHVLGIPSIYAQAIQMFLMFLAVIALTQWFMGTSSKYPARFSSWVIRALIFGVGFSVVSYLNRLFLVTETG